MNAPPPRLALAVREADLGAESARIDGFVHDHPDATLFHRPQWSRMVEAGCRQRGRCLVAERGGALVGLLPLTEIRSRLFGDALVSAGFATGGGIVGEGAEELARAAWNLGFPGAELRGGPIPEGWSASTGVYANFTRDLPANAEALLSSIAKRQRADVRRALSFELETTAGNGRRERDAHYRVYAESLRNLGTPVFPRALFEAALDLFGEAADIVTVWKDGKPLASLLNFYFKGVCQPFWGGGGEAARRWKANDLIYYDVLRRAIARGCTRTDFGRSKIGTGAYARKKIWDFKETPLTYAVRGPSRETNPLNPKYRLRIAAWRKLPLLLANRIGPPIARGLG
jgi:FemAB-related protein (PEP-CTERM system-associated)